MTVTSIAPETTEQTDELPYTAPQLTTMTGATYRQVDFWARNGLIRDTAHGSGSQRRFDARDVEIVHAVVGLTRAGIELRAAFAFVDQLIDTGQYTARFHDIYEIHIRVAAPAADNTSVRDSGGGDGL